MKLPISWLRDYVDFDDTPEGLADKLTFSGIEVEGIHSIGGDFTGIVVGEVLSVDKHPNADRLVVCRVNDGSAEHHVVCGAPNVETGGKYPFAPMGVKLPNGLKIKKAKIRGEVSEGMLLAEDELALSDDHNVIIELDKALEPGTPIAELLGPPDTVLELEITPNRPDCLSVIGVAREVAALYQTELKLPEIQMKEGKQPVEKIAGVEVKDTEHCPRYVARVIAGITLGPSPDWMQRRLTMSGIRPISNIVDITNYVLLECGQPLHAFDQALLKEGRIVVRRPSKKENMQTLDGIDRELIDDTLVIADAKTPVALAGIMGGVGSEIHDDTATVLLESACFNANNVRATSRRLGLSTESSYRFERGVDIEGVEWASRRAAALMGELAGGNIARGRIDIFPEPPEPVSVICRHDRVRKLTGMDVSSDEITGIFERLGLEVTASDPDSCTVTIPSFRGDLTREVDLIEEVARMHGLDHIQIALPRVQLIADADDRADRAADSLKQRLAGMGLREVVHLSLVAEGLLDRLDPGNAGARIVLPNPISQDQSVLRTSLVPQMVETMGNNHARQVENAAFFEMGRVHYQHNGEPGEERRLVIGLFGEINGYAGTGSGDVSPEDVYLALKGIWEQLAAGQGIDHWTFEPVSRSEFTDGYVSNIKINGNGGGCLGLIHEDIRKDWRLQGPVGVLEVPVDPLLAGYGKITSLKPLSPFPSVMRDMALIVDGHILHQDIVDVIESAAPAELESVRLFDIYSGEGVGEGKKSMAYSLIYRSSKRTLTDEVANAYHETIKNEVKNKLGAEIREG